MNKEALVMQKNEPLIQTMKEQVKDTLQYAKNVISAFNKLKLGPYPSTRISLISAIEFVKSIQLEKIGAVEVSGMKVKKEKVSEFFDLPSPEGMEEFEIAIDELKRFLSGYETGQLKGAEVLSKIKVIDSKVSIDENAMEHFEHNHTVYASNERQIQLYTKVKSFCDAINEFAPIAKMCNNTNLVHILHNIPAVTLNQEQTKLIPHGHEIKRIESQFASMKF